MGCCFWHDQVVYLANIHCSGEKRSLPVAILKQLLDNIQPDWPVGVLYDIGCSLHKFLRLVNIFFPSSIYSFLTSSILCFCSLISLHFQPKNARSSLLLQSSMHMFMNGSVRLSIILSSTMVGVCWTEKG